MQGRREPTHLEALLSKVKAPIRAWLQSHPGGDAMTALVAHVLHQESPERCDLEACLSQEALGKAGRAYLALLGENDRMPPAQQLTERELTLPRNLLLSFFQGSPDIQRRAQEVLGLIEHKFAERAFHQASILLQLFETDQTTRVQNERKLFYEDMIQRLGIRRREPLSRQSTQLVQDHFRDVGRQMEEDAGPPSLSGTTTIPDQDPYVPLRRSLQWLAHEHQLRFCLLLHDQDSLRAWEEVASLSDPASAQTLLRSVPPLRWRSLSHHREASLLELVAEHLTPVVLRDYIQSLTRTCYFILLAVGDTGLEGFIDTYFEWLTEHLGLDGTAFMDRLHRESTLGEQTLRETMDHIFEEFFAEKLTEDRFSFDASDLEAAAQGLIKQLSQADLSEVAPGHFDLGGLFLDHLLQVKYPSPDFPFRVHRIG